MRNVPRYVPEILKLAYQGMIYNVQTKKEPADLSYKDVQNHIFLHANYYTNLNSMRLFFPITISKNTDPAQSIRPDLLTVNNFLAHWMKELNITKYGDNI